MPSGLATTCFLLVSSGLALVLLLCVAAVGVAMLKTGKLESVSFIGPGAGHEVFADDLTGGSGYETTFGYSGAPTHNASADSSNDEYVFPAGEL